MTLFDTHAHLDGLADVEEAVARARQAGVSHILAIGGAREGNVAAVGYARRFPGTVFVAAGFDRDQAGAAGLDEELRTLIGSNSEIRAVGETGLDFHYHPETAVEQQELFAAQLAVADESGLPVVVHSREADAETLEHLRGHAKGWGGEADRIGVLHCFTLGWETASALLDIGFHISFSGIVTFRNAAPLREVARRVPADRLLIETDSPYLAPVPVRGKSNEPAYVQHVAECLAEVRGERVEDVARMTSQNGRRLFGVEEVAIG